MAYSSQKSAEIIEHSRALREQVAQLLGEMRRLRRELRQARARSRNIGPQLNPRLKLK